MATRIFCVVSLAALAAAQSSSTTVSLLFPNADPQPNLVGSVVGSDATATTYVVGCGPSASTSAPAAATTGSDNGSDGDGGCGLPESQTITQGPSTYRWVLSQFESAAAYTLNCALSGTTQAVCTEMASGANLTAATPGPSDSATSNYVDALPASSVATLSGSDLPPYQQVVITAGLSNLKAAGASSTGSATAAGNSGTSGSATSGGSSTASSTGSAKSSSGTLVPETALVMGMIGMLAVSLTAFAL